MGDAADLTIVDRVAHCEFPGMGTRGLAAIDTIIYHRIDEKCGSTAAEIAAWFRDHESESGLGVPHMPYHFVVQKGGLVEQALSLKTVGPHAWKWNKRSIGVAVVGDFRTQQLTPEQRWGTRLLTRRLWDFFLPVVGKRLTLAGHTACKDATKQPGKICPGQYLSPQNLYTLLAETGEFRVE